MRDWCRSCISCQRGKVLRHVQLHPEKILVPFRRFSHIHVDLVGPLPPSQGFRYLLTCVDRSTRWPEAIPLQGISTTECASALFHGWIARFGVPAIITSDRGAQFTSSLWSAVCSLLGFSCFRSKYLQVGVTLFWASQLLYHSTKVKLWKTINIQRDCLDILTFYILFVHRS